MPSEGEPRPIRSATSFVPARVPAKDASLELLVDVTAVRALTFTGEPDAWSRPLPLDERPAPGTVLDDRYEIGDLLGQGGMGYVLAAKHVVLGKRFAIKVLRPEFCASAEMAARFELEARLASNIGHPNIVEVTDFGTLPAREGARGASYFVMEHLEGESLAARLGREGRLGLSEAVEVVRQMASALGAAHAAGIVHRDVKPENVILTTRAGQTDHVKLLDFGIAKLESADGGQGRPVVLGTPAYMSPEQARGTALDARSDVYALGVVLFELLVGTVPFDAPHPRQIMALHATQPPPSLASFDLGIPPVVVNLVAAMLAKSPHDRPASMNNVIQTLVPIAAPIRPTRRTPVEASRPIELAPADLAAAGLTRTPLAQSPLTSATEAPRAAFTRPAPAPVPAPTTPRPSTPAAARSSTTTILALVGLVVLAVLGLALLLSPPRTDPRTQASVAAPQPIAAAAPEPTVEEGATPTAPVAPSPDVTPESAPTARRPHVVHPASVAAAPTAAPEEPSPARPATFGEQLLMDPWDAPESP